MSEVLGVHRATSLHDEDNPFDDSITKLRTMESDIRKNKLSHTHQHSHQHHKSKKTTKTKKKNRKSNKDRDFDKKVRAAVVSTSLADDLDCGTTTSGCSSSNDDDNVQGVDPALLDASSIRQMFDSWVGGGGQSSRPSQSSTPDKSTKTSPDIVPPHQMVLPRFYNNAINRGSSVDAGSTSSTAKFHGCVNACDGGTVATSREEESSLEETNSVATGKDQESSKSTSCKSSIGTFSTISSCRSLRRQQQQEKQNSEGKDGTTATVGAAALPWIKKMSTLNQEELRKYVEGMPPSTAKRVALQTLKALETSSCNPASLSKTTAVTNGTCSPLEATARAATSCTGGGGGGGGIVALYNKSLKNPYNDVEEDPNPCSNIVGAIGDEKSFYFDQKDDGILRNDTALSTLYTDGSFETMETEPTYQVYDDGDDDNNEPMVVLDRQRHRLQHFSAETSGVGSGDNPPTSMTNIMNSINAGIQHNSTKLSELRKRQHDWHEEEQRPLMHFLKHGSKMKKNRSGNTGSGSNDSTKRTKVKSNTNESKLNKNNGKIKSSKWKNRIKLLQCAFGVDNLQWQKQLEEDNSTNVVVSAGGENDMTITTVSQRQQQQQTPASEDIIHALQLLMCLCKERQISEEDFYHATTTKLTLETDENGCIEGIDATDIINDDISANHDKEEDKPKIVDPAPKTTRACWPASTVLSHRRQPDDINHETQDQPQESQQDEQPVVEPHTVRVITTTNSQSVYATTNGDQTSREMPFEVVKDIELIKPGVENAKEAVPSSSSQQEKSDRQQDVVLSYPSGKERSFSKLQLLNCTRSAKKNTSMVEDMTKIDKDGDDKNGDAKKLETKGSEQEGNVVGDLLHGEHASSAQQRPFVHGTAERKKVTTEATEGTATLSGSAEADVEGSSGNEPLVAADKAAVEKSPLSSDSPKQDFMKLSGSPLTSPEGAGNLLATSTTLGPSMNSMESNEKPWPHEDVGAVADGGKGGRVNYIWKKTIGSGSSVSSFGSFPSSKGERPAEGLAAQCYHSEHEGKRPSHLEELPYSYQEFARERSKASKSSSSSTKENELSQATLPHRATSFPRDKAFKINLADVKSFKSTSSRSPPRIEEGGQHFDGDNPVGSNGRDSPPSSPQIGPQHAAGFSTPPPRHAFPTETVELRRDVRTPSPLSHSSSPVAKGLNAINYEEPNGPATGSNQQKQPLGNHRGHGFQKKDEGEFEEAMCMSYLMHNNARNPQVSLPPKIQRMTDDDTSDEQGDTSDEVGPALPIVKSRSNRSVRFVTPLPRYERDDRAHSFESSASASITDSSDDFDDFDSFLFNGDEWGLCHEEAFDELWKSTTRPKLKRSTSRETRRSRRSSRSRRKFLKDSFEPRTVQGYIKTHPQALFSTVPMNYGDPWHTEHFHKLKKTADEMMLTSGNAENPTEIQAFEC